MGVKLGSIQVVKGVKGNTYRAQIRMKGYKHMSKSFKSKKTAEKWITDNVIAMSKGLPYETKEMRTYNLGDLIDRYIENEMDSESSNYKTRLGQLKWWKNEIGAYLLSQIKEDLICRYRDKLLKTPDRFGKKRSGPTVNRYLTSLSVVLDVARREWRLISNTPIKNIRKYSESQPRDRFLNHEERERLLDSCKRSSCRYLYIIALMGLCCGFRKSEILGLKWKDINFDEGQIIIAKTKNGMKKIMPLREPVISVLKALREVSDCGSDKLLFPGKNHNKPVDFRGAWKLVVKESGLNGVNFHDTRRSFITYLGELGYPLHIAAKLAGHKTLAITNSVYSQLSESQVFDAIESLGKDIIKK